jgi:hypothetical protein
MIASIGSIFFCFANFVAQALLVAIFWDLGKGKPTIATTVASLKSDLSK